MNGYTEVYDPQVVYLQPGHLNVAVYLSCVRRRLGKGSHRSGKKDRTLHQIRSTSSRNT